MILDMSIPSSTPMKQVAEMNAGVILAANLAGAINLNSHGASAPL
jgi:hypothetical protein